jgi:hypothetical protein
MDGGNKLRPNDRVSGFPNERPRAAWVSTNEFKNEFKEKKAFITIPYTYTGNVTQYVSITDIAGNQSYPIPRSVNWIKSTAPNISNLTLIPRLTGRIPFSFEIVDDTTGLASSCQNMIVNWSIKVTVGGVEKIIKGKGIAWDTITGTILIPWAGDYILAFSLTDAVGNSNTLYAGFDAEGNQKTSPDSFTTIQSSNSRVKILGAIGGRATYDSVYSVGSKFDSSLFATILNQMRKNVALLTRNVSLSSSPKIVNNTLFVQGTKKYSDLALDFPGNTDSLIIIWGDLIINNDIWNTSSKPKGIIVIKNEAGDGGNIYISGSVKRIQSSIFTEWSVFSGDSSTTIYNTTEASLASLPSTQLYIEGSLISRNTILGGLTGICTYNIDCTASADTAYRYDLNYFRNFQSGSIADRAYPDNSLDAYSLIIERDPRISDTPPPGWENK